MNTYNNYQLYFNKVINKYCTVPIVSTYYATQVLYWTCNQLTTKYCTVPST